MLQFLNHDFQVQSFVQATSVPPYLRNHLHKNRPNHGLALHLGGIKRYRFEEYPEVITSKNCIIYLPKGSNYDVDILEASLCYAINFDLFESLDLAPFCFEVKNLHNFLTLFQEAESLWIRKPTGYQTKCKALLYEILYGMQKEYEARYTPNAYRQQLLPAIAYIHDHYTQNGLTIGTLATLCHISEPYFRKLFHLCYGTSPLKYINQLRLTRAKELLDLGYYSVSQVAELAGFQSDCYFSREFKAHFGAAPSKYRRA